MNDFAANRWNRPQVKAGHRRCPATWQAGSACARAVLDASVDRKEDLTVYPPM